VYMCVCDTHAHYSRAHLREQLPTLEHLHDYVHGTRVLVEVYQVH
jgi:hypothetical protein